MFSLVVARPPELAIRSGCAAADSGAQLLWRVKADRTLPVLVLPDGSGSSVLVNPKIRGRASQALIQAARPGLGPGQGPLRPGSRARGPRPGRRREGT